MVGSQESIAPGVFTHPPVLQPCSLYTYSSPPRPLHGNQGRTRKYRNKVLSLVRAMLEDESTHGKVTEVPCSATTLVKYTLKSRVSHFTNRPNVQNGLAPLNLGRNNLPNSDGRPPFVTTVTRGKFLPSKFDLMVERNLYTYSSRPRPVGLVSRHQCSLYGGRTEQTSPPRGIHDYFNLMWDPHIRRGNTGTRVGQPDELEPKSSNETSGKGVRKKRSYNLPKSRYRVQTHRRTPPPIQGRLHNLVQTDTYLEDLGCDLSVTEADVNIQTDLMHDEPVSPVPIPMKTGIDASTQVLPGELTDFDDDVQPIVATLVAKILEQSLMETMEEEELMALKEQQNQFEEKKLQEEKQLKLLQEQHERITAERERLKRHLESQNIHTCAPDPKSFQPSSSGGPVYSTEYLLELLPSVLDSLRQEGFLRDNISDASVPNISSKPDNGLLQEETNSDPEGAIKENGMRTPADLKHEGEPWNALETLEKQLLASETMQNEK